MSRIASMSAAHSFSRLSLTIVLAGTLLCGASRAHAVTVIDLGTLGGSDSEASAV